MIYPKRCIAALLLSLVLFELPSVFSAFIPSEESPERTPLPRLEGWAFNFENDSFPLLSGEGNEERQFRSIVQAIELHLETDLEVGKVTEEFLELFKSLMEHFNKEEDLKEYYPGIVKQLKPLSELTFSTTSDRMVVSYREKTKEISLKKNLDRVARDTVKNASKLMGKEGKRTTPVLWYLWVEACLEVLESPYNSYTYSDQLAVSDAISTGKAFGPGLIPEVTERGVISQKVFDPILRQSGLVEGCELVSIDGEPLTVENGYQFDKWMRQDNFFYKISFKTDRDVKTIEAEAVPFRYPTLAWAKWQDIVYLRLSRFSRDSLVELRRLFRRLRKDPPIGLVIDLRGNPGGMANFALVDCFFKPGQVISTYRPMSESEPQTIEASIEYYDYPIVLLVNNESASMSEVFAAAVKTNSRGIVIGEKTFGKGVGQNCRLIDEEGRLCLVQDTFYYPGTEKTWNEEGILPDHVIDVPEEIREQIDKFLWGAALDLTAQRTIDKALDKAFRVLGENNR